MLYFRILVGDFAFRLAQLRDLGRELASYRDDVSAEHRGDIERSARFFGRQEARTGVRLPEVGDGDAMNCRSTSARTERPTRSETRSLPATAGSMLVIEGD